MTGPGRDALTVLVLAKEPRPGRCKTRLIPTFDPDGAAALAAAALADTLEAVRSAAVAGRVLVLDGCPDAVPSNGFDVVAQAEGSHVERIVAAFETVPGAAVLVGMDTPQLRPGDLELDLSTPLDAWLGPAEDGGWWLLGLRHACRDARRVLTGVPMSTGQTCTATRTSLIRNGLRVGEVRVLRDVDEPDDAPVVAAQVPGSRFAATLDALIGNGREGCASRCGAAIAGGDQRSP